MGRVAENRLSLLKTVKHRESLEISPAIAIPSGGMITITILSALVSLLSFRVRSRASLDRY
jgi:hypothetical protein